MKTNTDTKPISSTFVDPWKKPAATSSHLDELLHPDYADRQLRLQEGANWMRIVPAKISGSSNWMLPLHVLATPTGHFAHPRTYDPSSRSIWDTVYGYLHKTKPEQLYTKTNRDGLRLLPKPMSLCWIITGHVSDKSITPAVRLLMLSGYSGERGGSPGLGYEILQMANDRDENGDLNHNILSEEDGVQICIEKVVGKESKFPRYTLKAGRQIAPISELLARLPESEAAALQPLQSTIRRMSENEQWERLERLMPASDVAVMRKAIEQQ